MLYIIIPNTISISGLLIVLQHCLIHNLCINIIYFINIKDVAKAFGGCILLCSGTESANVYTTPIKSTALFKSLEKHSQGKRMATTKTPEYEYSAVHRKMTGRVCASSYVKKYLFWGKC